MDAADNLYIADYANNVIRKVDAGTASFLPWWVTDIVRSSRQRGSTAATPAMVVRQPVRVEWTQWHRRGRHGHPVCRRQRQQPDSPGDADCCGSEFCHRDRRGHNRCHRRPADRDGSEYRQRAPRLSALVAANLSNAALAASGCPGLSSLQLTHGLHVEIELAPRQLGR